MFEGVFCIKLQNSGRTFKNTFRLCECLNGIGFVIPPSTTLTPLNFLENPNVVTMGIAQLAATALPKSSLEWNTSTQRSLSNLRDFPISLMQKCSFPLKVGRCCSYSNISQYSTASLSTVSQLVNNPPYFLLVFSNIYRAKA